MFNLFKPKCQKIAELMQRANDLYRSKNYDSAIKLYQKILKLDSNHYAAIGNIATSYFYSQKYDNAIPYLQKLIEIDSANSWWYNFLSQSYFHTKDYDNSLNMAFNAVKKAPSDNDHHLNLAYTIYEIADELGAKKIHSILKKWYVEFPQNCVAKQCYKSFFYDKEFVSSDIKYVETLFDSFASDFDNVLKDLEYNSPQIIAQKIALFVKPFSTILDLGCGSGLCAQAIKKNVPECKIIGVDISAKMIEKAKEKNIYYKHVKSDITTCFNKIKLRCDAVVASDVFTYFGTLDLLFNKVASFLPKGGIFAFSVSQNTVNKKDFFLLPCSRFVHSEKYVQKLLDKTGFGVVENHVCVIRKEGGKDVVGNIFLCMKK